MTEISGIKIFRFDAPLFYLNVEYFQKSLYQATVSPSSYIRCVLSKFNADNLVNSLCNQNGLRCNVISEEGLIGTGDLTNYQLLFVINRYLCLSVYIRSVIRNELMTQLDASDSVNTTLACCMLL